MRSLAFKTATGLIVFPTAPVQAMTGVRGLASLLPQQFYDEHFIWDLICCLYQVSSYFLQDFSVLKKFFLFTSLQRTNGRPPTFPIILVGLCYRKRLSQSKQAIILFAAKMCIIPFYSSTLKMTFLISYEPIPNAHADNFRILNTNMNSSSLKNTGCLPRS